LSDVEWQVRSALVLDRHERQIAIADIHEIMQYEGAVLIFTQS
jgi:hypothetical protein